MINKASIAKVKKSRFLENFFAPLYDSYCFSNIPGTIQTILNIESSFPTLPNDVIPGKFEKVILLFIDAFGWRFFEKYSDELPFLKRFVEYGAASCITSQFPSTTAAHVTTIHTGLSVSESGVYEWFYYEPKADAVIAPLLFSFAGDGIRNSLSSAGFSPKEFFPNQTFYSDLETKGVKSYALQSKDYTPSPYSDVMYRGSSLLPYAGISQGISKLIDSVKNEKGKSYHFMYIDSIDASGHHSGPISSRFDAEVRKVFGLLEQELMSGLKNNSKDTLLIVTADHGQVEVDPIRTVYINKEISNIERFLKTTKEGRPIKFAGSARDLFLHVRDDSIKELASLLETRLKGIADVVHVKDHFLKLFGTERLSHSLLERLGNLLILPYKNESVFWYEAGRFAMQFHGHHGGLTEEELHTIFLALPL